MAEVSHYQNKTILRNKQHSSLLPTLIWGHYWEEGIPYCYCAQIPFKHEEVFPTLNNYPLTLSLPTSFLPSESFLFHIQISWKKDYTLFLHLTLHPSTIRALVSAPSLHQNCTAWNAKVINAVGSFTLDHIIYFTAQHSKPTTLSWNINFTYYQRSSPCSSLVTPVFLAGPSSTHFSGSLSSALRVSRTSFQSSLLLTPAV